MPLLKNTRIREPDYRAVLKTSMETRLDIVDVLSAFRHRWESSTEKQRREAIEQIPPKPRKGMGALAKSAA
jgi:hypothetical protein